eukprot:1142893-Pelagomonas_calceolata.AAC.4
MSVVTASLMPGLPSKDRVARGQVVQVKASAMASLCVCMCVQGMDGCMGWKANMPEHRLHVHTMQAKCEGKKRGVGGHMVHPPRQPGALAHGCSASHSVWGRLHGSATMPMARTLRQCPAPRPGHTQLSRQPPTPKDLTASSHPPS